MGTYEGGFPPYICEQGVTLILKNRASIYFTSAILVAKVMWCLLKSSLYSTINFTFIRSTPFHFFSFCHFLYIFYQKFLKKSNNFILPIRINVYRTICTTGIIDFTGTKRSHNFTVTRKEF